MLPVTDGDEETVAPPERVLRIVGVRWVFRTEGLLIRISALESSPCGGYFLFWTMIFRGSGRFKSFPRIR